VSLSIPPFPPQLAVTRTTDRGRDGVQAVDEPEARGHRSTRRGRKIGGKTGKRAGDSESPAIGVMHHRATTMDALRQMAFLVAGRSVRTGKQLSTTKRRDSSEHPPRHECRGFHLCSALAH
jgi:hypothetical protein